MANTFVPHNIGELAVGAMFAATCLGWLAAGIKWLRSHEEQRIEAEKRDETLTKIADGWDSHAQKVSGIESKVDYITKQFQPNGGSSLKDDMIQVKETLGDHSKRLASLERRRDDKWTPAQRKTRTAAKPAPKRKA